MNLHKEGKSVNEHTMEKSIQLLKEGNQRYRNADSNPAKDFLVRRGETAERQLPYAVIVTCSDSRVAAEHIFSAGIGDLFVVRTSGNVVSNFDLGSIEYACAHLGTKVILVMGHTKCGAVSAAMTGMAAGFLGSVLDEIRPAIKDAADLTEAIDANIANSVEKILSSQVITTMIARGEVQLISGRYDIETGEVSFFGILKVNLQR